MDVDALECIIADDDDVKKLFCKRVFMKVLS